MLDNKQPLQIRKYMFLRGESQNSCSTMVKGNDGDLTPVSECQLTQPADCTDAPGKASSAGIHGNRLKEDTTTLQRCQSEPDEYIALEGKT